ncbi:MAG: heavy-metal-associated domain-containing protein [Chloroflexi bacterium]|nr:heavy-metal-associated domain-containing protein [Chloroflexota bacterium]
MSANRVTLNVGGMHCKSCVKLVERARKAQPGVHSATVVLEKQQAIIEYDPQVTHLDALKRAVVEAGYQVSESAPTAHATAA